MEYSQISVTNPNTDIVLTGSAEPTSLTTNDLVDIDGDLPISEIKKEDDAPLDLALNTYKA